MPRYMVGLLAAVATAMAGLTAYAHGGLVGIVIVIAVAAAGLAAYAAAPPDSPSIALPAAASTIAIKKNLSASQRCNFLRKTGCRRCAASPLTSRSQ